MTERTFHADLTPKEFPFNFTELSSTVIANRGMEINRGTPNGFNGDEAEKSFGVCQPYYMENVLPISRGYSSVGFTEKIPAINGLENRIKHTITLFGPDGRTAICLVTDLDVWIYDAVGSDWQRFDVPPASLILVSSATIRETTYLHFGSGLYTYSFSSRQLLPVEVTGILVGATLGCCAAGSHLVLWTEDELFLSSTLDATDFTPSLSNGAASLKIQELRGKIVACYSLGQDFIVYSEIHAISARQTGSLAFPFRFKEIPGSAGILNPKHVAINANVGVHFTWTGSGLQQVSVEQATYMWPELSDGIIRALSFKKDPYFGILEVVRHANMEVSLAFLSNRYLAISTRAIDEEQTTDLFDSYLYDITLQRWGKLALPHVGFLEFVLPEVFNFYTYDELESDYQIYGEFDNSNKFYRLWEDPYQSVRTIETGSNLGIILPTGQLVAASIVETSNFRGSLGEEFGALTPQIMLGKFKIYREQGMTLEHIKVNKLFLDSSKRVYGHDYTGEWVNLKQNSAFVQNPNMPGQWFCRLSADSITLEFSGKFTLTDLAITASSAGQINQHGLLIETDLFMHTPPLEFAYKSSRPYQLVLDEKQATDYLILDRIKTFGDFYEYLTTSHELLDVIELRTPLMQLEENEDLRTDMEIIDSIELRSILINQVMDPEQIDLSIEILDSIELPEVLVSHTIYDPEQLEINVVLRDVITLGA